jgi:hypothetical protein
MTPAFLNTLDMDDKLVCGLLWLGLKALHIALCRHSLCVPFG